MVGAGVVDSIVFIFCLRAYREICYFGGGGFWEGLGLGLGLEGLGLGVVDGG